MDLQRTSEWWHRIHFPSGALAPLGFGAEYWDLVATNYDGYEALKNRHLALGRKQSDRYIASQLSRFLLDDALVAAGGVERAHDAFQASIVEVNASIAQNEIAYDPERPTGLGGPATQDAWYAFADLISWARAFEERLDRRPFVRRLRHQGLVPSLKPKRLRQRAERALSVLREGPVGQARNLTNFSLHAALVRNPMSGVVVAADGKARLPMPGPVTDPVHHWYALIWNQDCDAVTVADAIWQSVAQCLDDIIIAFELSVPKRLRAERQPFVAAISSMSSPS